MIVFVESNFILEITYLQEQHVNQRGNLELGRERPNFPQSTRFLCNRGVLELAAEK